MPGAMLFLLMPALRAAPPIIGPLTHSDTVYVAAPTGDRDSDRASIAAAIEQVQPGGIVQFARGSYRIGGEIIRVTAPQVTLLGHSAGTTLRACNPDEYEFSADGSDGAGRTQLKRSPIKPAAIHLGARLHGRPTRPRPTADIRRLSTLDLDEPMGNAGRSHCPPHPRPPRLRLVSANGRPSTAPPPVRRWLSRGAKKIALAQ